MSAIDDIRKLVVPHLLEKHYQAKELGREFFFTVEITDPRTIPYLLQPRVSAKATLKVSFYGNREQQQIAYLIIADNRQVFLVIDFDAKSRHELEETADELSQYIFRSGQLGGVRGIDGFYGPGQLRYIGEILESTEPTDVLKKIDRFIDDYKESIDDCINNLQEDNRFNFLFLSQVQFDAYIQTEPNYEPLELIPKIDLALTAIRITNYKGINNTEVNNIPKETRWIVLTGENGFGKTSVLQAIAAGLYGNNDESGQKLVPATAFIAVDYFAGGKLIKTSSRDDRKDSAGKRLTGELATYGSSRLQVSGIVTREMIEQRLPTTYHLFNSDGLLLNVEQLLKDTSGHDKEFFKQLVCLFKALIPQLADIRIETVNMLPEVQYIEQDDEERPLNDGLPLGQLAAGFRNIIAMIGDLVYRLSIKQKVKQLRDLQGIVLIDELELHLHPTYQKLLPEVLTNQFPNLQFIVSTHSPIPLLGIPKNVGVVLLHVARTQETGIVIEQLDVDFSVLTPNAILSSPIFGFKELIPESKSDNQMIRPENTYDAIKSDQQLRQSINEFLSPNLQKKLLELINKE